MNTTIITSMYNMSSPILKTIDYLFFPSLLNNGGPDKELIIIDDCSPSEKETKLIIDKYFPELKHKFGNVIFVRNKKNLGFAKSYNKGIFMASGQELIVTNDDVYFPLRSIDRLVETLFEPPAYVLAGPITNEKTSLSFQYCKQAPLISAYDELTLKKLESFSQWLAKNTSGKIITTDNISGFCFCANAEAIKKIGGFKESYKYGYYEDTDLVLRLAREYGPEKIAINTKVFISHGGISGVSGSFLQKPMKANYFLLANSFKFAHTWGYDKLLKHVYLWLTCESGKGTISELFPKKINF